MKTLTSMLLLLFTSLYGQAQQTSHNKAFAIDALIKKEMKNNGIPGIAVAVIKNGAVLFTNTYGIANMEWNQPVTANTTFQIASVTKLFTSTLILKWIQENKIRLDDPISKYVPDSPESWKTIQIKHLIAHEGGIPWPSSLGGYIGIGTAANFKVESSEELIRGLRDSALLFPPGTKQAYQNGDYFVLQYILEKIGGKSIDQLLAQDVFQPLDMKDSGFDLENRSFPFQTMKPVLHKSQNFTKGKTMPMVFKGFYSPTSYGAAGLFLSIRDGIKWAIALDKASFLTKATQENIHIKTPSNGGFTQMGWTVEDNNGYQLLGHSGGPGLGDIIRFEKEKLTVIVLSNYADMYPYLATAIAKIYLPNLVLAEEPKTFDRGLAK